MKNVGNTDKFTDSSFFRMFFWRRNLVPNKLKFCQTFAKLYALFMKSPNASKHFGNNLGRLNPPSNELISEVLVGIRGNEKEPGLLLFLGTLHILFLNLASGMLRKYDFGSICYF